MDIDQKIKSLGNNIKEIRLKKNLSQIDLSSMCNMEQSSIARIETGKTNVTIKNLFKIAEALEINITELFA